MNRLCKIAVAGALLSVPLAAQAQSFQPGWTSWGGANLGASTLARQRAAIARRNGQFTPSSVSRDRPVRAYRTLTPPPPPGASYEERAAWARQEMIREAAANRQGR